MLHISKSYNERIQDNKNIIPDDEPVFLLRAQDALAASLISRWADDLQRNNGDPKLVKMAREHAVKMREWQQKKKIQ